MEAELEASRSGSRSGSNFFFAFFCVIFAFLTTIFAVFLRFQISDMTRRGCGWYASCGHAGGLSCLSICLNVN